MSASLPPNVPPAFMRVYDVKQTAVMPLTPFSGLREDAQRETAYALGVETGVAWRYNVIDNLLERNDASLTELYNFAPLLLDDGRVMPPVVTMSEQSYSVQDSDTAQSAVVTWHITSRAHILTVPPTWERYLIKHFTVDMSRVNVALLPKTAAEKEVWHTAVIQGWNDGIDHANRLYSIALSTLTRDYLGVARYQLLAREGVLSIPHLSVGDLGVVVNSSTMVVGAKVYRIVEDAKWQEQSQWQAHPGF